MIISGIVIVVIGVILLEIFGSILLQKDTSPFVLFAFAGFFMIATGFIVIYGEGKEGILLGTGRLKENAIYETVSSVPEKGKWVVVLRNQDGDLFAHLLDQNPPKVFKKTNDPKNPYQSYPSAP